MILKLNNGQNGTLNTRKKGTKYLEGDASAPHVTPPPSPSLPSQVRHWQITEIYARSFPLTKVKYMKDHIKPCVRENNPYNVIIHVSTNELESERQSKMIPNCITNVAKIWKQSPAQSIYLGYFHGTIASIIKRWISMKNFQRYRERLNKISWLKETLIQEKV